MEEAGQSGKQSGKVAKGGLGSSCERLDDVIKATVLYRDVRLLYHVGYQYTAHGK